VLLPFVQEQHIPIQPDRVPVQIVQRGIIAIVEEYMIAVREIIVLLIVGSRQPVVQVLLPVNLMPRRLVERVALVLMLLVLVIRVVQLAAMENILVSVLHRVLLVVLALQIMLIIRVALVVCKLGIVMPIVMEMEHRRLLKVLARNRWDMFPIRMIVMMVIVL